MTALASPPAPSISKSNAVDTINLYKLGLLFVIRCRYWSCRAGNEAQELALTPQQINARAIASFGSKDLLDPEQTRKLFQQIEKKARHVLERHSRPFAAANAHFVPWQHTSTVIEELERCQNEFADATKRFLDRYDALRADWQAEHPEIPEACYPLAQDLANRFDLTWHAFKVTGGAIGRQVALQAAAMGVPRLQLIDHDSVEAANLAPQGYLEADLGCLKVDATAGLCRQIYSQAEIIAVPARFQRSRDIGDVLFCCVDSIATRQLIWSAVQERVRFFADSRMSAETLRVLAVTDPTSRLHYATTFFAAAEAHPERCTAKATIYAASVAAGLLLAQCTKWMRGMPVEADISLNLLTSELTILRDG